MFLTDCPPEHLVSLSREDEPIWMGLLRVMRLRRQYVQNGIREIAEDLCTRQLGYRTELDAAEAERREITETRFTSLDRRLLKDAPGIGSTGIPASTAALTSRAPGSDRIGVPASEISAKR